MKKTLLKKLLCSLVITLMIGTSIPAQAGNVSNPTSNGKSGTSGGGAGQTGGANGVAVFHTHSANAYHGTCPYHSHSGNSNSGGACYSSTTTQKWCSTWEAHVDTAHWSHASSGCSGTITQYRYDGRGDCGGHGGERHYVKSCDKCSYHSESGGISSSHYYNATTYYLSCGRSVGYQCGKTPGVSIDGSSKSYGGNSNLSTTDTLTDNRTSLIGSQTGNGIFHLKVVNGNVLNGKENNTYLNNTVVRDKSNPNSVGEISYQDLNNKRIVEWETPDSNGTEYEFKAQTYKINFDSQNGTDLIMDTEFN